MIFMFAIIKKLLRQIILFLFLYPLFLLLFIIMKIISIFMLGLPNFLLRNEMNIKSSFFGDLFFKDEYFNFSRINNWHRPAKKFRSIDDYFIFQNRKQHFVELLIAEPLNIVQRLISVYRIKREFRPRIYRIVSFIFSTEFTLRNLFYFLYSFQNDFVSFKFFWFYFHLFFLQFIFFFRLSYLLFYRFLKFFFFFVCRILFFFGSFFIHSFFFPLIIKLNVFFNKHFLFLTLRFFIRLSFFFVTLPFFCIYIFLILLKIIFLVVKLIFFLQLSPTINQLQTFVDDLDFFGSLNFSNSRNFKKKMVDFVISLYFRPSFQIEKQKYNKLLNTLFLFVFLTRKFCSSVFLFFYKFIFYQITNLLVFFFYCFIYFFLICCLVFFIPSQFFYILLIFFVLVILVFFLKLFIIEIIRCYYIYILFFWKLRRKKYSVFRKNILIETWDRFLIEKKYIRFLGTSVHTIYNKKFPIFKRAAKIYSDYMVIIKKKDEKDPKRTISEEEQKETFKQTKIFRVFEKTAQISALYKMPKREIFYSFLFFQDILSNELLKEFDNFKINYSFSIFLMELNFYGLLIYDYLSSCIGFIRVHLKFHNFRLFFRFPFFYFLYNYLYNLCIKLKDIWSKNFFINLQSFYFIQYFLSYILFFSRFFFLFVDLFTILIYLYKFFVLLYFYIKSRFNFIIIFRLLFNWTVIFENILYFLFFIQLPKFSRFFVFCFSLFKIFLLQNYIILFVFFCIFFTFELFLFFCIFFLFYVFLVFFYKKIIIIFYSNRNIGFLNILGIIFTTLQDKNFLTLLGKNVYSSFLLSRSILKNTIREKYKNIKNIVTAVVYEKKYDHFYFVSFLFNRFINRRRFMSLNGLKENFLIMWLKNYQLNLNILDDFGNHNKIFRLNNVYPSLNRITIQLKYNLICSNYLLELIFCTFCYFLLFFISILFCYFFSIFTFLTSLVLNYLVFYHFFCFFFYVNFLRLKKKSRFSLVGLFLLYKKPLNVLNNFFFFNNNIKILCYKNILKESFLFEIKCWLEKKFIYLLFLLLFQIFFVFLFLNLLIHIIPLIYVFLSFLFFYTNLLYFFIFLLTILVLFVFMLRMVDYFILFILVYKRFYFLLFFFMFFSLLKLICLIYFEMLCNFFNLEFLYSNNSFMSNENRFLKINLYFLKKELKALYIVKSVENQFMKKFFYKK